MMVNDVLSAQGIARLDGELLLAHVLRRDRSWLMSHGGERISEADWKQFHTLFERRARGEPLAYVIGYKEFYGRRFIVNRDVLIPRPATEGLIESTLDFLKHPRDRVQEVDSGIMVFAKKLWKTLPEVICDVGTGSGSIAITLALEGVKQSIIGIDTSSSALRVARTNAKTLGADVTFVHAVGTEYIRVLDRPFLLVSNPPYISSATQLPREVSEFEPQGALFAGSKGTDVLLPLIMAASANVHCVGYVVECKSDQVAAIR